MQAPRLRIVGMLFGLAFCMPLLAAPAGQAGSHASPESPQEAGKRIFQRACAVCHVSVSASAQPYAPALFRGMIAGNEEMMAKIIAGGLGDKMPGFQYALQPEQINEILQYLTTLDKPAQTVASEYPQR